MSPALRKHGSRLAVALSLITVPALHARADVVTDWNAKANGIAIEAKLGTPPAIRVIALVQTAVRDAVVDADSRTAGPREARAATPSVDAAVAAANRATLLRLLPAQATLIGAAYDAALATVPDGPGKQAGVSIGERAASAVLAARADDNVAAPDTYRPSAPAGAYVPTAAPAAVSWPQRKPWLMTSASQFRPGPPPALAQEPWARDLNEVKALGGRTSTRRTAEQTEIARFWEYSLPPIYFGLVESVAKVEGRSVRRNAELYAAVAQAMDDAMISVFDAKYHYNFWRPVTAIRNADLDGHDATERDASWSPLVENPLHPEYPSAHAILAGVVGTLLQGELRPGAALATSSPSAKGATRRWSNVNDLMQEVANARIYGGLHYRSSSEAGLAAGRRIGDLAATRLAQSRLVLTQQ